MENKKEMERLKYLLTECSFPIYINFMSKVNNDLFGEYSIKINANCNDEELSGFYTNKFNPPIWYIFLDKNKDKKVTYLVIDLNSSTIEEQARFIDLVKDRKHQTLEIPDNCKIIVISDEDTQINSEFLSCLVRV